MLFNVVVVLVDLFCFLVTKVSSSPMPLSSCLVASPNENSHFLPPSSSRSHGSLTTRGSVSNSRSSSSSGVRKPRSVFSSLFRSLHSQAGGRNTSLVDVQHAFSLSFLPAGFALHPMLHHGRAAAPEREREIFVDGLTRANCVDV